MGAARLLSPSFLVSRMGSVWSLTHFVFRRKGAVQGDKGCAPGMKSTVWMLDERKFLSSRDQKALRAAAEKRLAKLSRARLVEWFAVELGLESGLRVSEMAALVHDDLLLHFAGPVVWVRRGKGGRPRLVRVRQEFVRTVARLLRLKDRLGIATGGKDPVFAGPFGKALGVRALQLAFTRTCKAAAVFGHSIHHLRHTYASELYRASGGNLRLVQKQLGHARITTTQVYADVFDEDATRAVERLYARNT